MKSKILLAIVGAAVLGAIAWFLSGLTDARLDFAKQGSTGRSAAEVATGADPASRLPGGTGRVKTESPHRAPLSATTANELIVGGASKYRGPGEEVFVRTQVAELCGTIPSADMQQKDASSQALAKYQQSFCNAYSGNADEERGKLLNLPTNDPFVTTYGLASEVLEAASQGSGSEEAAEARGVLEAIASAPGSGFEGLIAAEALHQYGYVSPALQAIARDTRSSMSRQDLADAQLLATRMRMCDRYGGCGAGQLQGMTTCSAFGVCDRAASADGAWQQVYSPQVYQAARRLKGD